MHDPPEVRRRVVSGIARELVLSGWAIWPYWQMLLIATVALNRAAALVGAI
ncbi:hypothetical protein [Marivita sp. S2033]|uniref:hypothetical protein n=1 Tax=Marivita sp. S2033 TaxID=3373187 RepID=UPI003982A6C1